MRGSLKQRYTGTWSLILDLAPEPDPKTGVLKRKQKWITFRGTKPEAEARLAKLLTSANEGTFVEPTKVTLGSWLREWLDSSLKPSVRPSTYTRYKGILEHDLLKAPMAAIPLQRLRGSHLESYYAIAQEKVSASTLTLHHAILHRALGKAKKETSSR